MAKIVPPMNFGLVEDGFYRSAQPSELNFSFLEKLNLASVIWVGAEEPSDIFQSFLDSQGIPIHNLAPTLPLNSHFPPGFASAPSGVSASASSRGGLTGTTPSFGGMSGSAGAAGSGARAGGGGSGTATPYPSNAGIGGLLPFTQTQLHLPPLPPPPEPLIIHALTLLLHSSTFPVLVCCNMGRHRTGTVVGCYRKLQRWALSSILEEYRRYAGMKVRVLNEQFIELFDTDLVSVTPDPALKLTV